MSQNTLTRIFLLLILGLYGLIAAAFAIHTPDWQTPDEPAHYNYIAQIAEQGRLPRIEMGDWDQAYLDALRASRFEPALLDDLDRVQYEDHQPPLYYVLATPVYLLSDGSLGALRLYSAAWGLLIVFFAYATGRLIFPQRPWIALGAAAFVAFLPQHVHILASVNNDALGWAIVALCLWATLALLLGRAPVKAWHLGLLVGLGFITKATTYFLAGIVPLALLLRWWLNTPTEQRREKLPALIRDWLAFGLPALGLGLLWWLRNFSVYGFPDFLGLAEHDAVVIGQPRTAELIDRIGFGAYLREIGTVTLNSFVGRFGWMGVPMSGWSYQLLLLLMAVGLLGALLGLLLYKRRGNKADAPKAAAWLILGLTILLSVLAYLYYNLEFQQHQGRYMYPLLIPLGLLIAYGFDVWLGLLLGRLLPAESRAAAYRVWLTPLLLLGMAPLCVWLLWRVIEPNLRVLS